MKRNTLLILSLLAAVAGGAWWWWSKNKAATPAKANSSSGGSGGSTGAFDTVSAGTKPGVAAATSSSNPVLNNLGNILSGASSLYSALTGKGGGGGGGGGGGFGGGSMGGGGSRPRATQPTPSNPYPSNDPLAEDPFQSYLDLLAREQAQPWDNEVFTDYQRIPADGGNATTDYSYNLGSADTGSWDIFSNNGGTLNDTAGYDYSNMLTDPGYDWTSADLGSWDTGSYDTGNYGPN